MSFPVHPDTIIIKNQFYQEGLSEAQIWNYYQKVKPSILKHSNSIDLIVFIIVNQKLLVVRKNKDGNNIRLTKENYDQVVTGRTISFHATMKPQEKIAIVDIDTNDFDKAKQATEDCYKVLERVQLIRDMNIRFTGKSSFHIQCNLIKKMAIDSIRFMLEKVFNSSEISDKYTVSKSRRKVPNIDLFRNTVKGGFIIEDSLAITGLRCMNIDIKNLSSFTKEKAII